MNFHCELCIYHTSNRKDYIKHEMTAKHKKRLLEDKNEKKSHMHYHCEFCDFHTSKKTDYTTHCMTAKHKKLISGNKFTQKIPSCFRMEPPVKVTEESSIIDIVKQVIILQSKQEELAAIQIELTNKQMELTNKQMELAILEKQQSLVTTNNNCINNNCNNNQFNLQFFLNDTCKNASNFTEFIDNISVSFEDIKTNGELGFANGITKIIVDNLKQLNLENRPIHCTDVKRETFYVKDENQWEKDKSTKIIEQGINEVKRKGINKLVEWREETPEREEDNHPFEQLDLQMHVELTPGHKMEKFFPKMLSIIAKETKLEKDCNIMKQY